VTSVEEEEEGKN